MADEAIGLVNREVRSLDDLGVAGGAPQFHSPSHLTEMFSMGETDVLEDHISHDIFLLVTPLLQAIPVINLIMELRDPFPDQEIGHCEMEIYPLPLEMIEKPGTAVTVETGYFVMGGRFP